MCLPTEYVKDATSEIASLISTHLMLDVKQKSCEQVLISFGKTQQKNLIKVSQLHSRLCSMLSRNCSTFYPPCHDTFSQKCTPINIQKCNVITKLIEQHNFLLG